MKVNEEEKRIKERKYTRKKINQKKENLSSLEGWVSRTPICKTDRERKSTTDSSNQISVMYKIAGKKSQSGGSQFPTNTENPADNFE